MAKRIDMAVATTNAAPSLTIQELADAWNSSCEAVVGQ
jgi:hypothetical protein